MLRLGPGGGVQRVTVSTEKAAAAATAGPPKAAAGVLSFRSIVQKTAKAGASEEPEKLQSTVKAKPATKAPPPTELTPSSKAPGAPLVPIAKAPVTPGVPEGPPPGPKGKAGGAAAQGKRPAPKKAPPQKPKKQEVQEQTEEAELDGDDWVRQFEQKWSAAMEGGGDEEQDAVDGAEEAEAEEAMDGLDGLDGDGAGAEAEEALGEEALGGEEAEPPAKRPRLPPQSKAAPAGAPPRQAGPGAATPGGDAASRQVSEAASIRDERREWATRCPIEPARPGQPQRLTISMAEVGLGDSGAAEFCAWMERRFAVEQPAGMQAGGSGRSHYKASSVDFSENQLGAAGAKALCAMLEKHSVRCEVLRLSGNSIGNEGVRCVAKYLTSSGQAMATELHLSRNRITSEGMKWLLGCLAIHPAYPVWSSETERYVPLWIRAENVKLKGEAGYQALEAACTVIPCSVCLGESNGEIKCGPRQCVNVGCCDELKHNCVAHLCSWEAPDGAAPLPTPAAHARPIFGPAGRGAPRAPPSGVEAPARDEPRLIYEDEDLAVLLKPSGWSCAPQPKGVNPTWAKLKPLARRRQVGELMAQEPSPPLQAWLLLHFGADPTCDASRDQSSDRGLAHRLDVDCSGPLLVGKTLRGFEHARKQIAAGLLKDYLALVHGTLPVERGECHAAIDTSPYAETKRVRVDPAGQPATTVWEAIAEYESPDRRERYTLVHCRMVTLRTHQLRAHLQHLGHPLVGDKLYGDGDVPAFCPRLFLHKYRIGFFNLQGQACLYSCSLQTVPDLWKALGRLRKVGGMAMMGCGAPGL